MSKIEDEIENAYAGFRKEIDEFVSGQVYVFARDLVTQAIIERQSAPGSHNFTGNLLNSIVVCVYKNGAPEVAYYPSEYGVAKAIRFKMSGPKVYHFKHDYDGDESSYEAMTKTNQGWGEDDARNFFREYNPGNKSRYCIVVAYTTEYASFVDSYRHTTGFTGTYSYAKHNGWRILKLLATNEAPTEGMWTPF